MRRFVKLLSLLSLFLNHLPPRKLADPLYELIYIKECFEPSLVEISLVILEEDKNVVTTTTIMTKI